MKKTEAKSEIVISVLAALIILLLLLLFFSSCYSEGKASRQFERAAGAYPKLPMEYCAENFEVKERVIKGDSTVSFDTLYLETIGKTDTVVTDNIIRITTTLPPKIITKTIRLTDTVIQENTAKIKLCETDRGKVISMLENKTIEADNWEVKAKKRGQYMWLLILIIIGLGGWKIYSSIKRIKK